MENLIIANDNDSNEIKKKIIFLSTVMLNRFQSNGNRIGKITVTTYLNADDDKTIKEVGIACEQITDEIEYIFGNIVTEINFLMDKTKSYKHTYSIHFQ